MGKKKIGYGHLKNSGECSRAILALLFIFFSKYQIALTLSQMTNFRLLQTEGVCR